MQHCEQCSITKVVIPILDGLRKFISTQMQSELDIFTVALRIEENNCGIEKLIFYRNMPS